MFSKWGNTSVPSHMCSPTWETNIPSVMCCPFWETHIPSDMCLPSWKTHLPSFMCSPCWGTHILCDICYSPRKHISLLLCVPLAGKHIYLVISVPHLGNTLPACRCLLFPLLHAEKGRLRNAVANRVPASRWQGILFRINFEIISG